MAWIITLNQGCLENVTCSVAPEKWAASQFKTLRKMTEWTKEIVTEVHGTKDGEETIYRMGTLTCKGALPTGVAPAIAAVWLAEGRVDPGVYPPETALDPVPFFKELEQRGIITQVTVTQRV